MTITFECKIKFPDGHFTPEQEEMFGAWIQEGARRASFGVTKSTIENAYEHATGRKLAVEQRAGTLPPAPSPASKIIMPPNAGKIITP